jgi:hypothetical protein
MKKTTIMCLISFLFITTAGMSTLAHVPYLEFQDYTDHQPFNVKKTIEQSIAVYAWLEYKTGETSTDVDVYTFTITKPARVYIEVIVPVCEGFYEEFVPWFAFAGQGFPNPPQDLPFEIPEGYGVFIAENVAPGETRETFYEPFGGKSYYKGPIFDQLINQSGTYYIYYWDPYQHGGDYVAVLGRREAFGFDDIIRALLFTPLIRLNLELHLPPDYLLKDTVPFV